MRWMITWLLIALLTSVGTAATINITSAPYSAVADCATVWVSTTTNSAIVVTTNQFVAGDVGKVVQMFGAGRHSTLLGSGGIFNGNYSNTPTNHQDLAAVIASVGTLTITLDRVCGATSNGTIRCTYGTDNRLAITNAIQAAASNDVVYVPAGNYMVMTPNVLNSNYVQATQFDTDYAVTITKGGFTLLGDGTNASIITFNGTWQQKGIDTVYFGSLFNINNGPSAPTNNGPLIFNGIQFNGNATRNHSTLYTFWPPVPTDGSGWGNHHAFTDGNTPQGNTYKSWTNCLFTRWHGETIAGIADGTSGFIDVGNCAFIDGNSTVINFNYRHDFHDNLVADYYQVAEDGQFLAGTGTSRIFNNVFTNIWGVTVIALVGASTNWESPAYLIANNNFAPRATGAGGYGIMTAGIKNLTVSNNLLNAVGIILGSAGSQGTMWNSNIVISANTFTNMQVAIIIAGNGANRVQDVLVNYNTGLTITEAFGESAEGAGSQSTNVVFSVNTSLGPFSATSALWSTHADGQWFYDDPSNSFPFKNYSNAGTTNIMSYEFGYRHQIIAATSVTCYVLSNNVAKIPMNARMLITNANNGATATSLIVVNGNQTTNLPSGGAFTAYHNGLNWQQGVPGLIGTLNIGTLNSAN
jgi:hypothetical protein